MAHILKEVKDEMQRDHKNKLEMLRVDHSREMKNIREKYMDEVRIYVCNNGKSRVLLKECAGYTFFQLASVENKLKMILFLPNPNLAGTRNIRRII